jgi:hypothetical protein
MCVIVIYKFNGGHVKKFRYFFFASNDRFSAKSGRDSVVEFWLNSTDLLVNSANLSVSSTDFQFSQIFLFLLHPKRISAEFYQILLIFFELSKNRGMARPRICWSGRFLLTLCACAISFSVGGNIMRSSRSFRIRGKPVWGGLTRILYIPNARIYI